MSCPMGVSAKDLAFRSIKMVHKYPSSFLIWVLKVDCETQHSSAARPKCSRPASATRYLNSLSVIPKLPELRASRALLRAHSSRTYGEHFCSAASNYWVEVLPQAPSRTAKISAA